MLNIRGFGRYLGLVILMPLQSCFANPSGWNSDTQSYRNAELRIQVCLPSKRIYFDEIELDRLENHPLFTKYSPQQLALAPKTVRRVVASGDPRVIRDYGIRLGEILVRSGQFSDDSGFMPLRDSTVSDQPIFDKGYGYPVQNYVAMHVRLPDTPGTYWFVLPKAILTERFSDWFSPVSMETGQISADERFPIWWKLTHGADLPIYPVSADAPKMRVKLLKRHAEHNDPARDSLPALISARMKYKTTTHDRQFAYEFVPTSDEAIPKCD